MTALLLFGATRVRALDPGKAVTQYVHNFWTSNEGLPQDSINSIVQTSDGYLWLATQEGLVRFDGGRFVVFDSSNTEGLGSFIYTIFADSAGTLWIGTGGGLMSYRDGKFSRYGTADGLPDITIKHISEDASGNLWLSAAASERVSGGQGLTKFKEGRGTILTTKDGLSNNQVYKTVAGKGGELWIGTGYGLNVYKDGKFTNYTTVDGLVGNLVKTVYEDRAGNLWIGTTSGLNRYQNGRFISYTTKDGLSDNNILSIFEDHDGNLWIGTNKGLNRFKDEHLQSAIGIEGISNDQIFSFLEDREGSLWIGTHAHGLHRLRDAKFTNFGSPEGIIGDSVQTVYEDRRGRLWIGTSPGGLSVLENGRFTTYSIEDGLLSDRVRAIYEDRAGNLWIGTASGLNQFRDGKFNAYTSSDGLQSNTVRTIYEDETGALWIGTNIGLSLLKDNKFINFSRIDGIIGNAVNFVHRDRSGRLLVGGDEGISVYMDGKFIPLVEKTPVDFNPQSVSEDPDGSLWITTWGQGLNLFKDGKLISYTVKDGIYDNSAWSILDDGSGNLWMGSNRGIFRVSKQQLNDFADGKINSVTSVVYGVENGMRKRETNAGSPAAIRSRDGRFWFGTTSGAVVIDPNNININNLPPPVVIEKLVADEGFVVPRGETFEIPAGTKNVEFQYVGLSFVSPERVRYKYKIEGFDRNWIDAEGRRAAYYTNLPPGTYTFKVITANNDGVWNEEGATLKFRVLTPFWRTWWFFGAALLSFSGVLFLSFKWRIARLKRAHDFQRAFSRRLIESQEQERKRIAAELHDNLGQRLIIIKNWASLGIKLSGDTPARGQLEEISTTALQAIGEVREIIYDLRPVQLESAGLTNTIRFMIEQVAASSNIRFALDCDELDNLFSPEDEVTFYRMIQECVSNAVKHSEAENIGVGIARDGKNAEIKVFDDGKGFTDDLLPRADQRGGFGLTGLKERAAILGGVMEIHSVLGRGTTISIKIEENGK